MEALRKSAAEFSRRVVHRGYIVLVGVAGSVLGTYGDLFGGAIKLSPWMPWSIVGASLFIACFWAFHDLRVQRDGRIAGLETDLKKSREADAEIAVRRGVAREIGEIINEGGAMAEDYWAGMAFSEEEANIKVARWWNGAGVFIETTLGPGERHIISEPFSAHSQEDLLTAHCNLLRGVLQRLPSADIRVGEDELQEAISIRRVSVKST